ncbi:MAG TPA: hypothetical protein VLB83_02760 [Candidatus Paceibacterota bacterium]|nr:hypothetical protein [Candidatus Paceibacterota bacterium]
MAPKRPRWKEKRELQGYSYDDVIAEIDRRVAGEYFVSTEEARATRKKALAEVGVLFRFSALVHDFLNKEGLTLEEFFELHKDDDSAHRDFLVHCMDPFSRVGDIRQDGEIDLYYPGGVVERRA